MTTVLSKDQEKRINAIVTRTLKRAKHIGDEQEKEAAQQEIADRLFRRHQLIERRRRDRIFAKYLASGMVGLKVLLELGQSPAIQRLIELEEKLGSIRDDGSGIPEFSFYDQTSARLDAPDRIGIYLRKEGIALYGGCDAAFDFEEKAFFRYKTQDDELRELLADFVCRPNDKAYDMLNRKAERHWEWGVPESDMGFPVLVDCGNPDRFARYIDHALKRFRPQLQAA